MISWPFVIFIRFPIFLYWFCYLMEFVIYLLASDPWEDPPELTLEKSRDHWYLFSLFSLDFFHLSPQIWAHMGPYGPVWTRISFYIAFIWFINCFYIVFTLFLYDFRWFYKWFWEFSQYVKHLKNHVYNHLKSYKNNVNTM